MAKVKGFLSVLLLLLSAFPAFAADFYVDNAATGTGTGASWVNAKTTMAAAATASAAGDRIFCRNTSAETQASAMTISFPGTGANPNLVISTTNANTPPLAADVTAGCSVATTGNNGITVNGSFKMVGVTLSAGSTLRVVNLQGNDQYFQNGVFAWGTRNAGDQLIFGGGAGIVSAVLDNTTLSITNSGQSVIQGVSGLSFEWKNTPSALTGTALSTTLFSSITNAVQFWVHGVDLSACASGCTLFDISGAGTTRAMMSDVKISALATICGRGGIGSPGLLTLVNVDSGATGYRNEWDCAFQGDVKTGTSIVRGGGATDGVQAISHQFVTTANSAANNPLMGPRVCQWSTLVSGSHTVAIEIAGAQSMDNSQIWPEVEYLGSASSPLSSFVSGGVTTPLTTPTTWISSSATWSGSPANKQVMSVTIAPRMAGLVCARVMQGLASTTENADPVLTIN